MMGHWFYKNFTKKMLVDLHNSQANQRYVEKVSITHLKCKNKTFLKNNHFLLFFFKK